MMFAKRSLFSGTRMTTSAALYSLTTLFAAGFAWTDMGRIMGWGVLVTVAQLLVGFGGSECVIWGDWCIVGFTGLFIDWMMVSNSSTDSMNASIISKTAESTTTLPSGSWFAAHFRQADKILSSEVVNGGVFWGVGSILIGSS